MQITWYYLFKSRDLPYGPLLEKFTEVSGLKVNWTKSKILPLHSHPIPGQADLDNPLQWVTQMKYLGLMITNSVTDFIGLNISPLLAL